MHPRTRTIALAILSFLPALSVAADTTDTPAPLDDQAVQQLLAEGRDAMQAGRRLEAITDKFDPVIRSFEQQRANSGKLFLCARSQMEMFFYSGLGAATKQETVVLDTLWSDAYLLKGYAPVELGEVARAREALQAAVALAPQNAQYLAELAYNFQAAHEFEKSIEIYEEAIDAAELSPTELQKEEHGRALRGKGYSLIELGRLDEAEEIYKQALKINRSDKKARDDLTYIKGLRKKAEAR